MSSGNNHDGSMAECGSCRELIPIDSPACPSCGVTFSGVSDEALGECGACNKLVPIDSTKCPECGVVFVADDVVDVLRSWLAKTGISVAQLFERFDADGNGIIDSEELRNGLLDLNLADLPPSQVERLVETIDENGDGQIDLGELELIIEGEDAEKMGYSDSVVNRIMKSFNIEDKDAFIKFASTMDEDENRYLKESELKKAATVFVQTLEQSAEVEEKHEPTVEPVEEESSVEEDTAETESEDETPEEIEEETEVDHVEEDHEEEIESDTFDEEEEIVESEEAQSDEEEDHFVPGQHKMSAMEKIVQVMDEEGVSVVRFFNNLDKNGDGILSHQELLDALQNELRGVMDEDDIAELIESFDDDGDGNIDLHEFIESLEELEDHEDASSSKSELSKRKEFPTPLQTRLMSKRWNDVMYPILHTLFGLMIIVFLVNALVGPVDGEGGSVALVSDEGSAFVNGEMIIDGTIYQCDNSIQKGGCSNSLTPLAGDSSSMPKGFYWDGILGIILSLVGLGVSTTLHLVLAPSWRARMKAMKEVQEDQKEAKEFDDAFVKLGEIMVEQNLTIREVFESMDEDNSGMIDGPEFQRGIESIAGDALTPAHVQSILESLDEDSSGQIDPLEFIDAILDLDMGILSDYEEQNEAEDEEDTDDFRIDDFIGLVLYDEDGEEDEEVYGIIIEIDDEDGMVTIEEDDTGDEITGYLEDAFFPEE